MTQDAVRLQGRLAGSKRKRNENKDDVMPHTNGITSKSGDNDDSDQEESRVEAVSRKEKPKSVFDKFPVPVSKKKKQSQAGTLANSAAVAPEPATHLPTSNEPALSKARSPGATANGVPILFPTASKATPVPHRTPSPTRSTSISFGSSRISRSISRAARRSLKRKAIFKQGRLEIVEDLEAPPRHCTGTPSVTTDPPSPSPSKHQVNKGKGKEKEAEIYVPLSDLGMPKAKGKPHTPPPREGDPAASQTTPHPPRIRQSLPNGSAISGKSVPQLEPITLITQPNQEPDSPKIKKRNRKRKKKKHQQVAGDANAEGGISVDGHDGQSQ